MNRPGTPRPAPWLLLIGIGLTAIPLHAQTVTVSGDVSADDGYAIYTTDLEYQGMPLTFHGDGNTGDGVCLAESFNFSTDDRILYLAAFSDDLVAQGLVHDLTVDGVSVASGTSGWEVCPTGVDLDTYPLPTTQQVSDAIVQCTSSAAWVPPVVGGPNGTFNTARWCGGPVSGVGTQADWVWHESGNCPGGLSPFEPGCDHDELLVFRRCVSRIRGGVTADDFYAIYTSDFEGPGMTVTNQGNGNHPDGLCVAEQYDFLTTDNHLYVAAFSDDAIAQGLLHDLRIDETPAFSGTPVWQVCPTGVDIDAYPEPTGPQMATQIQRCNNMGLWQTPTVGGINGQFNTGKWCGTAVQGIPSSVEYPIEWSWYESGNCPAPDSPFVPGCFHNEMLIFRTAVGCPQVLISWIQPLQRAFPQDLPLPVYVDPTGLPSVNDADQGVTATLDSIENWDDAGMDLILPVKGSPGDPNAVPAFGAGDGISVIRFDPMPGVCGFGCIGSALITVVDPGQTGECGGQTYQRMIETDIVINSRDEQFTSVAEWVSEGSCDTVPSGGYLRGEWFIEHVASHEVGHLIGLGHPPGGVPLMGTASPCDDVKTQLTAHDIVATREGYTCNFSQIGVFADTDGDGAGQDVDCDDQNATVFVGAPEACDLRDNDCNGLDDAAEGLDCAVTCVMAPGGPSVLQVDSGVCSARLPGFRNVFVRGTLSALHANGGVAGLAVDVIGCPQLYVYDRADEATKPPAGQGWFYLVRDDADPDFGAASGGTPRTPVETGCP